MRVLFFIISFIVLFSFIRCSVSPFKSPGDRGDIADKVKSDGPIVSVCEGEECCSEHENCVRVCNQIFYKSTSKVRKRCHGLPQDAVTHLEDLMLVLKNPLLEDLERLYLDNEFRLLLALDYQVWVHIIQQTYTVNQARGVLIWMADSKEVVEELLQLKQENRSEIMYAVLEVAGDPTKPGPVEEGLAQKISFDQTFLQLMVSHSNYGLLQITHDMIKDDLCSIDYGGESQTELCMLRIYCKEKINQDNEYIHSEDLRNEIARNIPDEDLFTYINKHILRVHPHLRRSNDPIMNNQVCLIACNDGNRGCE